MVRVEIVGEEDAVGLYRMDEIVVACLGSIEKLTATIPQVKQLTVEQVATQTQPYPPSGGLLVVLQRVQLWRVTEIAQRFSLGLR